VAREAWWLRAPERAATLHPLPASAPGDAYRLGDGVLELECEDAPLGDRLRNTYAECRVRPGEDPPGPRVRCLVRSADGPAVLVGFEDPAPLDTIRFAIQLFPDRGYRELPFPSPGWRLLGDAEGQPLLAADDAGTCLVGRTGPWQGLVGSLAVNRVLRLQQDVLFFHAASAVIGGAGLLVTGPKGAGKSTTALTLAAREHGFLGDEVAAVRVGTWDLLPMRRAVSLRPGPRSRAVEEARARHPGTEEVFPDGTRRVLLQVRDLFPAAAARGARLHAVFFLGSFRERACVRSLAAGPSDVRRLAPLGCTLWGAPPGRRLMHFLQLLSGVRSFLLEPGDPDETADLIERTVDRP
jgi:hypothetical protein